MGFDYFLELNKKTDTRFWINNPTGKEIKLALGHGAVSCTTNPAYCSNLISREPEYINKIIDEVIQKTKDNDEAATMVYQIAAQRIMEEFLPTYEKSDGKIGYITVQDDPRRDEDTEAIIRTALKNKKLGRNYMAKIPVIKGGIEAIEACIEENIPVCATEVFSISQAESICEICEKAAKRKGKDPMLYITHISGIFDEYLGKVAKRENIQIDSEILKQAGVTIARKEYELLQTYGGKAVLLGGGARGPHHFTELVGGNVHVTINWSTAQEIIDSNILINSRIDAKTDSCVIDELCEKFIDFKKAYDADGLEIPDFASFGPVQLFRNSFLKGWYLLLAKITERRSFMALS